RSRRLQGVVMRTSQGTDLRARLEEAGCRVTGRGDDVIARHEASAVTMRVSLTPDGRALLVVHNWRVAFVGLRDEPRLAAAIARRPAGRRQQRRKQGEQ